MYSQAYQFLNPNIFFVNISCETDSVPKVRYLGLQSITPILSSLYQYCTKSYLVVGQYIEM